MKPTVLTGDQKIVSLLSEHAFKDSLLTYLCNTMSYCRGTFTVIKCTVLTLAYAATQTIRWDAVRVINNGMSLAVYVSKLRNDNFLDL